MNVFVVLQILNGTSLREPVLGFCCRASGRDRRCSLRLKFPRPHELLRRLLQSPRKHFVRATVTLQVVNTII